MQPQTTSKSWSAGRHGACNSLILKGALDEKAGKLVLIAGFSILFALNAMADNLNAHSETFRDRQTIHFTNSGTHNVHFRFNFSYDYKCRDNIYTTWQHVSLQGASMDMSANENGYAVYYFQPCATSVQVTNEKFEWVYAEWQCAGQANNIAPPRNVGLDLPENPLSLVPLPQGDPVAVNYFGQNQDQNQAQPLPPQQPPYQPPSGCATLGSWANAHTVLGGTTVSTKLQGRMLIHTERYSSGATATWSVPIDLMQAIGPVAAGDGVNTNSSVTVSQASDPDETGFRVVETNSSGTAARSGFSIDFHFYADARAAQDDLRAAISACTGRYSLNELLRKKPASPEALALETDSSAFKVPGEWSNAAHEVRTPEASAMRVD